MHMSTGVSCACRTFVLLVTIGVLQSALAVRQQRSNGDTDGLAAMQENMLDLMPDESRDLLSKKRVMHWDRQKKKYVKVCALHRLPNIPSSLSYHTTGVGLASSLYC